MIFIYKGKSKFGGIYKITNTLDGKVYIGSAKKFSVRANQHRRSLEKSVHQNKHLQAAFNRDGTDSFTFEVIEVVEGDRSVRTAVEQTYLDELIETWELCYNFRKDASRSSWSKDPATSREKMSRAKKGKKLPQEHKDKISNSLIGNTRRRGKKTSKETKVKMSKANKGKVPWNKGKKTGPLTQEHREAISKARTGKPHPHKGRRQK